MKLSFLSYLMGMTLAKTNSLERPLVSHNVGGKVKWNNNNPTKKSFCFNKIKRKMIKMSRKKNR